VSSIDCAIEARQLVKTYPVRGKKPSIRALDGLAPSVPRGIIYGLLRPYGAGKSTTVKILPPLARPDLRPARVERHVAPHRLGPLGRVDPGEGVVVARERDVVGGRVQGALLGPVLVLPFRGPPVRAHQI